MERFGQNFVTSTEQADPILAHTKGTIPEWLRGSLVRVGPGKFDFDDFHLNHWLDGFAIMYKFSIENGKVKFSKRYLQSDAYKKANIAGRPIYTEFGTRSYPDPTKSIFSRMLSTFDPSCMTDNANGNIFQVGNEVFVATETCFLRRVDPHSLETREKIDLHKIAGINFASSHPVTDETGTTYNICSSFTSGPKYHILRVPPSRGEPWLKSRIMSTISSSWKANYSYIHSFGISQNYIVFLEQPLLINTFKLATSSVKGRTLHECTEWHPNEKVRFHVVKKSTGEIVKTKYISDEPFFVLHHVNAYEVKDQIVVDLICYSSPDVVSKFYLDRLRMNEFAKSDPPQLTRYVLPLVDDIEECEINEELVKVPGCLASAYLHQDNHKGDYIKLHGVQIGDPGADMPVINNEYRSHPYRFVYASGGYEQENFKNALSKVDVETGLTLTWRETDFQYPGEPIFVGNPNGSSEDDGVILVGVGETRPNHQDALVILDAKDMTELARAVIPSKIPHTLHGTFLNNRF